VAEKKRFPDPEFEVFAVAKNEMSEQEAQPGDKVPIDDDLVEDLPNGPKVGFADGHYTVKQNGDADFVVTLHFDDDESTLSAVGKLKRDKGKFGKGKLNIKGGTGKGTHRGKLDVQVVNPKRYTHEP
jgi:hypothetical protein